MRCTAAPPGIAFTGIITKIFHLVTGNQDHCLISPDGYENGTGYPYRNHYLEEARKKFT